MNQFIIDTKHILKTVANIDVKTVLLEEDHKCTIVCNSDAIPRQIKKAIERRYYTLFKEECDLFVEVLNKQ